MSLSSAAAPATFLPITLRLRPTRSTHVSNRLEVRIVIDADSNLHLLKEDDVPEVEAGSRKNLAIPGWVFPVVIGGFLPSFVIKTTYDDQIRRFWNEIRDDWFANERRLAEDPRNGLTE